MSCHWIIFSANSIWCCIVLEHFLDVLCCFNYFWCIVICWIHSVHPLISSITVCSNKSTHPQVCQPSGICTIHSDRGDSCFLQLVACFKELIPGCICYFRSLDSSLLKQVFVIVNVRNLFRNRNTINLAIYCIEIQRCFIKQRFPLRICIQVRCQVCYFSGFCSQLDNVVSTIENDIRQISAGDKKFDFLIKCICCRNFLKAELYVLSFLCLLKSFEQIGIVLSCVVGSYVIVDHA